MTKPKVAAILGGGITGLSTAYYIRKKFGDTVRPIIFEKSHRCGGWIETVRQNDGVYYDTGPRSFRPVGLSGFNTLDLVEEIGLDKKVLYVTKSNPASRNRFIFSKGQLVRLPTELSMVYKQVPPFEKPLISAVIKDLFTPRYKANDDTVFNFVQRRFGKHVAMYAIDPLIRGVCAGDAQKISVKLTLARQFEYEQKYGSVILGHLIARFRNVPTTVDEFVQIPGYKAIGLSTISLTCLQEGWSLWGLENGTETLVERLQDVVENEMKIDILRNAEVNSIQFGDGSDCSAPPATLHYTEQHATQPSKSQDCDFIVSTIPSWNLASILRNSKPSHSPLTQLIDTIEGVDVLIANVVYNDPNILKEDGFGFLVPSNEVENTPEVDGLLGVVFDSCVFDQGESTVLTIIRRHTASGTSPSRGSTERLMKEYLKTTLGITREPDVIHIKHSRQCIPQYTVGHSEKVDAAKRLIKASKLPLMLSGASFEGISVNDCIYSGKRASEFLPFEEP